MQQIILPRRIARYWFSMLNQIRFRVNLHARFKITQLAMASTRPRYNSMLERKRYLVMQQCTTRSVQPSILVHHHILPWIYIQSRRDGNSDKFLSSFFYQMSDTVYVIRYIGMLSGVSRARARDPLLSHCIFSARESSPAFRPSPSHLFSSPSELLSSSEAKIASVAMSADSRYGLPTIFIDFKTAEHTLVRFPRL